MEITEEQEKILRHMLGAQPHFRKNQWGFRNHYCSPKQGNSYRELRRMEELGLVTAGRVTEQFIFFYATLDGCKAIKLTKTQIARAFED